MTGTMRASLGAAVAVALLFAAACAVATPAGDAPAPATRAPAPSTIEALRASMLASDSILIARLEVEHRISIDTSGKSRSDILTRRVVVNQVRAPWMKRFVAGLLPPGCPEPGPEPCATPRTGAGLDRPWMLTALWIEPSGRGQVYLNLVNGCATAGLAGGRPGGMPVAAGADSLLALFQEGLYADTLLRRLPAHSLPDTTAASSLTAVETLPELLRRVAPEYPDSLRSRGVRGVVTVRVFIGADGTVRKSEVVTSVRGLDDAALAAVKQWRFKPATLGGQPRPGWVSVAVGFPPATPATK